MNIKKIIKDCSLALRTKLRARRPRHGNDPFKETVEEETGYNFTEVQRMINDYFFSDDKNLDEVFGEAEDVEDDEEE